MGGESGELKNVPEIQKERVLRDAEAIQKGAEFKPDTRLHFTDEQIRKAKNEMKHEQNPQYRAYIDWESFREKIGGLISLMDKGGEIESLLDTFSKQFLAIDTEITAFENKHRFGWGPGHGGVESRLLNVKKILRDTKMKSHEKTTAIKNALQEIERDMIFIATGMDVIQRISQDK